MSIDTLNEIESNSNKTKRIATNTLVLFMRMFVLTIINLYVVRIVLNRLGTEDYGIFNTVAGVVTISTFISNVLALSIQRFYSVALGKRDIDSLTDIFSISVNIVFIISLLILLFFETFGLWFINNKLVIPESRMVITQWVYQFGLVAFLLSFVQIPYSAAIFAHEKMNAFAIISTIECLLKLGTALLIGHCMMDNLLVYSGGLTVTAIIIFCIYLGYSRYRFKECHYHKPVQKSLYKGLLFFSGWAMFGSVASVCIMQGNTIILNLYFGPAIIAAFAIAIQINNAFNSLCSNIVLAFRPAMIKAYAEQDFRYLNQMFSASNKFLLYILLAIALPLILEMRGILGVWLGNITEDMVLFCRLMIIFIICLSMNSPISIIMHATGKIKEYNLPVESVTLLCLPLTWTFFKLRSPSYYVFISMIGVFVVAHMIRLFCLRKYYTPFSIQKYFRLLILPALLITVVTLSVSYEIHIHITTSLVRVLIIFLFTPLMIFGSAYRIGISENEKMLFRKLIKNFRNK